MARIATVESEEGRSLEGESGEALADWRSFVLVENETPSTSPPYRDTESDDDNGL